VTWLPQAESGVEDVTIALGMISATANSLPGHSNCVQSLVVSGIPVGAVLTDCTNSFTATRGDTSIDVTSWDLSKLKITPPNDTNFTLTVTATDQDANTASASELVKVGPLPPCLNPVAAHGNEDTAIALDFGVTAKSLSGANGDASPNSLDTVVVKDIPVGATLSDGTGLPGHSFTATAGNTSYDVASWNLSCLKITPPAGFEGCFTLTIAGTDRDSEGDISATVTACEVVKVAPVADPPTASAPAMATTAANTAIEIQGVLVGPPAEDADDTVSVLLSVEHGALAVCPVAGVAETVSCPGSLTVSGTASDVNAALASLVYTPSRCFAGCDTLNVSVTSQDGNDTNPTQATNATAIKVNSESESLILGGPGATLTSGATAEITPASAATTDVANANGGDTSLVVANPPNFTNQNVGLTSDDGAGWLSASQTFTSSPTKSADENLPSMHGAGPHGFDPSSTAQFVSGGTVGASGDSFHFGDENSGFKGGAGIGVAGLNDTHGPMGYDEDAGTGGPQAISEGGETPGAPGDSFHFKHEISGFEGSRPVDVTELYRAAASIVHHENLAATDVPPAISAGAAQAIELPPPDPDDHCNIAPGHLPRALVSQVAHDLIV
ncbi:MAG: hypothetical protein JOZ58_26770, partial [Acetobacteraceae bacterium]|nr:hypothetical protein [Acetobacteraceae bacterium]